MPTVGTTSKPAYIYDAGTDTWVPVGVGAHTHDTSALVSVNSYSVAGKNTVINGGFDIWQRGTSIAISGSGAASYAADRWYNARNSTGQTVSRQATGDTTNLPNIQYCARVQRDSGNTDTSTPVRLSTAFETANSIPLAGKTVTFSLYARKGANFSATSNVMVAQLITGTGTDQNALTGGYTSQSYPLDNIGATLTTTWQRFTVTGVIPANVTEITLNTYYIPTGTAGANDYYEITGVQLEVGSVATQFARSSENIQGELAACQRYYLRHSYSGTNSALIGPAYARTTGIAFATWTFPVTMRSTPTLAFSNGTQYFNLQIAGGDATFNTLSGSSAANTDRASLRADAGAHTIGQAGVLGFNNSAAWIEASAEL
jgi:hypothetical protein